MNFSLKPNNANTTKPFWKKISFIALSTVAVLGGIAWASGWTLDKCDINFNGQTLKYACLRSGTEGEIKERNFTIPQNNQAVGVTGYNENADTGRTITITNTDPAAEEIQAEIDTTTAMQDDIYRSFIESNNEITPEVINQVNLFNQLTYRIDNLMDEKAALPPKPDVFIPARSKTELISFLKAIKNADNNTALAGVSVCADGGNLTLGSETINDCSNNGPLITNDVYAWQCTGVYTPESCTGNTTTDSGTCSGSYTSTTPGVRIDWNGNPFNWDANTDYGNGDSFVCVGTSRTVNQSQNRWIETTYTRNK